MKDDNINNSYAYSWIFVLIIILARITMDFKDKDLGIIIYSTLTNAIITLYIIRTIYEPVWIYFDKLDKSKKSNETRRDNCHDLYRKISGIFLSFTTVFVICIIFFKITNSIVNDIVSIVTLYLSIEAKNFSYKIKEYYENLP
jgi:hypothetical protein